MPLMPFSDLKFAIFAHFEFSDLFGRFDLHSMIEGDLTRSNISKKISFRFRARKLKKSTFSASFSSFTSVVFKSNCILLKSKSLARSSRSNRIMRARN